MFSRTHIQRNIRWTQPFLIGSATPNNRTSSYTPFFAALATEEEISGGILEPYSRPRSPSTTPFHSKVSSDITPPVAGASPLQKRQLRDNYTPTVRNIKRQLQDTYNPTVQNSIMAKTKGRKQQEKAEAQQSSKDLCVKMDDSHDKLSVPINPRDVTFHPNIFRGICGERGSGGEFDIYHSLVEELEEVSKRKAGSRTLHSWHRNNHHVANTEFDWRKESPTFNAVVDRLEKYFGFKANATRLNWYKDDSEWKPFHQDASAIHEDLKEKQNFTVTASFGRTRDFAFRAGGCGPNTERGKDRKTSFPISDGSVLTFGREVNEHWEHALLPPSLVKGEIRRPFLSQPSGRISVVLWGRFDGAPSYRVKIPARLLFAKCASYLKYPFSDKYYLLNKSSERGFQRLVEKAVASLSDAFNSAGYSCRILGNGAAIFVLEAEALFLVNVATDRRHHYQCILDEEDCQELHNIKPGRTLKVVFQPDVLPRAKSSWTTLYVTPNPAGNLETFKVTHRGKSKIYPPKELICETPNNKFRTSFSSAESVDFIEPMRSEIVRRSEFCLAHGGGEEEREPAEESNSHDDGLHAATFDPVSVSPQAAQVEENIAAAIAADAPVKLPSSSSSKSLGLKLLTPNQLEKDFRTLERQFTTVLPSVHAIVDSFHRSEAVVAEGSAP